MDATTLSDGGIRRVDSRSRCARGQGLPNGWPRLRSPYGGRAAPRAGRGAPRGVARGARAPQAAGGHGDARAPVGPHRLDRPARRGPVGRAPAGERGEDGPALRLPPAPGCSRATAPDRHPGPRLCAPARRRERRRRRARGAPRGGERGATPSRGGGASPLRDLADEPFAAAEIRRLEELRPRAAELAIDADLAEGRHRRAAREVESLVAENPLRERLHGQRMLALYRAGRQAEALAAFREARAALVDQDRRRARRRAAGPARPDPRAGSGISTSCPAAEPPPARPLARGRRRRRLVAAAGALFAGLGAFGVSRLRAPDSCRPSTRTRRPHRPGRRPDPGAVPVGRSPGAVAPAAAPSGREHRSTLRSPGSTATATGRCDPRRRGSGALAFAAGSLWVADGDPAPSRRSTRGPTGVLASAVGNAPRALAAARARRVAPGRTRLHRIDLVPGADDAAIPVGATPRPSRAGAGALWAASEEAGTVTRVDPRTGAVIPPPINVGNGPGAIAVGKGAVWVLEPPRRHPVAHRSRHGTRCPLPPYRVGRDPGRGDGRRRVGVDRGRGRGDRRPGRCEPRARAREAHARGRQPGGARARGRIGLGRRGLPRRRGIAAGRSGSCHGRRPPPVLVPINWLRRRRRLHPLGQNANLGVARLRRPRRLPPRRPARLCASLLVGALAIPRAPPPSRDGRSLRLHAPRRDSATRTGSFAPAILRFFAGCHFLQLRAVGATEFFPRASSAPRSASSGREAPLRPLARHRHGRAHPRTDHDPPDPSRPGVPAQADSRAVAYLVPFGAPARSSPDWAVPGTGPYRFVRWDSRTRRDARAQRVLPRRARSAAAPAGFADSIEVRLPGRWRRRRARSPTSGGASPTWRWSPTRSSAPCRRSGCGHWPASAPARLHSDPVAPLHGLDVPQRAPAAVRRPARAPRGQPRDGS